MNMFYGEYFAKYGYIYGDSYKYEFGRWSHRIVKFTDLQKAEKWLKTEEYDFREREFITKKEALALGYRE